MSSTGKPLAASFAALLVLSACGASRTPNGYATIVQWDKQGGTLALKGDDEQARQDARARMKAYCRGSYQVIGIERIKVGESTTHSATTKSRSNIEPEESVLPDRSVTNDQQVTRTTNIYETQVTYVCTKPEPAEEKQIETEPPKTSR
jgi:hypothetical protein